MKICIIGLGFVGNAMYDSFNNKNTLKKYEIYGYDKYKNGGIGELSNCTDADIIFTALPTLYDEVTGGYDNTPTYEILSELNKHGYNKTIVIKSTVEPLFTSELASIFTNMNFIHNPEFLSAKTSYHDFHNQKHIVLGKENNCLESAYEQIKNFYYDLYSDAEISECTSTESECMKIFCNSFYAVKIQFFNELYLLTQKINVNYDRVMELMIKNGWINPKHTSVPGPDGKLSYNGMCFPKDTSALLGYMKKKDTYHMILDACVKERNAMTQNNQ